MAPFWRSPRNHKKSPKNKIFAKNRQKLKIKIYVNYIRNFRKSFKKVRINGNDTFSTDFKRFLKKVLNFSKKVNFFKKINLRLADISFLIENFNFDKNFQNIKT